MATHSEIHVPGYRPFKKGGWGVALFICALAAALWVTALIIHRSTYIHPRDHRFQAIGSDRGHGAPATDNATPAAESHGSY